MKKLLLLKLLFFIPYLIYSSPITVTNTNNSGAGSLAEAITQANSLGGGATVFFNIPTSDPNYSNGIWTITLTSNLPYITGGGISINATTQPGYSNTPLIAITTSSPYTVLWSFGVFSSDNTIKGFLVYGFNNGILVSEPTGINNTIENNYIGSTGTIATPNNNGIVLNNSANNNTIKNNLISGNLTAGIVLKKVNGNTIIGNKIGTNLNGNSAIPNENGIMADSSSNNIIGGINSSDRNLISGNSQAGILISGRSSTNNTIQGNYIGTNSTGDEKIPNLYGVTITKSHGNIIGKGNLISGNEDIGVLLTGKYTRENIIKGNLIGTDVTGTKMLSNHKGIIIKSLANSNKIGGKTIQDRNIISGNLEIGIYIEAADSNITIGNLIGTDISGMNKIAIPFKNPTPGQEYLDSLVQGNGIEFNSTAKHNILGGYEYGERNVVSGHKVYGVVYYGNCSENHLYNNFIGTDITSKNSLPNATGICFDCASHNNDVINCVLSGNLSYGLFYVTRGTEGNRFLGNMVGVDSSGTVAVPNDIGIVVSTGTRYNIIGGDSQEERNIFSGNRLSGMMITNQLTEYNEIKGNYFGTDITGTVAIPNRYGITLTTFAKHNNIENNLLSGNEMAGLIIYENADSNLIVGNKIGTDINGSSAIPNGNGGIYIDQGASYNTVGTHDKPNIIAYNIDGGILIKNELTLYNKLSGNSIFDNDGLGIDIFPFSVVNENDNGDWDSGPSDMLNFPVISHVGYNSNNEKTWITGNIDSQNPSLITIEIYKSTGDTSDYGQGKEFIGSVNPDEYGAWNMITELLNLNDTITAIAIDKDGNTSEFSLNSDITLNINDSYQKNLNLSVFPNPCSDNLNISFKNNDLKNVNISVYDANAKLLIDNANFNIENNCITLDLKKYNIVNSGNYIISVKSENGFSYSKMFNVK